MREILFRGKIIGEDKWTQGYYVCLNGKAHRIYTGYAETDVGTYYPDKYTVCPETVGQFTGLTDKNGTKIFEGDILQADEYKFVVKFGECGGVKNIEHEVGYIGFYVEPIGKYAAMLLKSGLRTDILYWINSCDCEVVGNIHDNPELLEVNNE